MFRTQEVLGARWDEAGTAGTRIQRQEERTVRKELEGQESRVKHPMIQRLGWLCFDFLAAGRS